MDVLWLLTEPLTLDSGLSENRERIQRARIEQVCAHPPRQLGEGGGERFPQS